MNDLNKIKRDIFRIIKTIKRKVNNNLNALRGKIYREQVSAENKARGLTSEEIKNELQLTFYSNKIGKFLISFCEYIMYVLVFSEIIIFFGSESLEYETINLFLQLGIIELFIGLVIGSVCYIKNKHIPILIYAAAVACTYFLRLEDHRYYNMLNLLIVMLFIFIDILIVRKFIKADSSNSLLDKLKNLFRNNDSYDEISHTEIMIRCPKCGCICGKDDNFCVNCGERIKFQRRVERNSKKSINNIVTSKFKKGTKNSDDTVDLSKTDIISKTAIIDNIEEKIIKHTEEEY